MEAGVRKPIKHSFAAWKNAKGHTAIGAVETARVLVKGWGDIPKHINDLRAAELHWLAVVFLSDVKRLQEVEHKLNQAEAALAQYDIPTSPVSHYAREYFKKWRTSAEGEE